MGLISPTLPTIGQPNSTEDVDIINTLTALRDTLNGNIDAANILNGSITAAELGDVGHADSLQPGVMNAGDAKVTAAGAMSLSVATGTLWVRDASGLMQRFSSSGASLTVPPAHATLPRIDQVIATLVSPGAAATLSVLQGTATSGATRDNRLGAASLPTGSLRLVDVEIGAAVSSIVAGNLRDRRSWARGAFYCQWRTAGDINVLTSTTSLSVDSRIECSGVPIEIMLSGSVQAQQANTQATFGLTIDGVLNSSRITQIDTAFKRDMITPVWMPAVAAGSHLFQPQANLDTGTGVIPSNASVPLLLVVREHVRQNASND